MPRSAAVRDAARGFAATRLGGRPYVALHVRPYPDSCLEYWLKVWYRRTQTAHTQYVDSPQLNWSSIVRLGGVYAFGPVSPPCDAV